MQKETIYSEEMEELIPSPLEKVMIPLTVVRITTISKEKQVMINFSVVMEMT